MMELGTRTVGCPLCLLCHFLNCLAFYFLLELIQFTCCFKCIVKKSFSSKGSYCLSILSLVPPFKLKYNMLWLLFCWRYITLNLECIAPGPCSSDMEVTPPSTSPLSPHPHCLESPWNGVQLPPHHPLCLFQRS